MEISGNIWNPNFFKIGFQMVQFSKGWALAKAMVPTTWKPDIFVQILNDFWQKGGHLSSGFQMVVLWANFQAFFIYNTNFEWIEKTYDP